MRRAGAGVLAVVCVAVLLMGAVRVSAGVLKNAWGRMSGTAGCPNCGLQASIPVQSSISAGTFTTFNVTGAGTAAMEGTGGTSINASGEIAGIYIASGNVSHGFVRSATGTITTF
ncbi:MAG: hypothetical protein ABSD20_04335, partial [Terriglobales bacterium]